MKISYIITIGFAVLLLIYVVSSFVIIDINVNKMKQSAFVENIADSKNLINDLDQFIKKRIDDFQEIANAEEVQRAVIQSNNDFENLVDVETFLEKREDQQRTTTPFIREITDNLLSSELQEIIEFYKNVYEHNVIDELFITNQFGANVALGIGTSDYRQDDEEWWQITKRSGLYLGTLEFNKNYDSYSIPIGIRIVDDAGNFNGVLRISLSLDDILADLKDDGELLSNEQKNLFLVDDQGRIIFSNIKNWQIYDAYDEFGQIIEETNPFQSTSSSQTKFVTYSSSTGFREFPGLGWYVVVEQDEDAVIEQLSDIRNEMMIISIVGVSAAIVIGFLISYSISKPLKRLTTAASQLSDGNLDYESGKSRFLEFQIILDSFDKASDSIRKLIETEKTLAETQAKVKNERLTAIGELSSSLAHDLKNPLASIKTGVDVIKRSSDSLDPRFQQEVFPRMENAIKRMSHQIEDVMNYVRVTPTNLNKNSLKEILNSAISNLQVPDNVSIILPKEDFFINSDKEKFEIVFINLILNAIQSIGEKTGNVSVSVIKDKQNILIQIQDDGEGISDEHLVRIFLPLFTTKMKGTGLGLAICKNIIEQHGWEITVKNKPTRFIIKIPMEKNDT